MSIGIKSVRIVEFHEDDAQKLAELFNSFDKEGLWPGGFTGGVPFTRERVLDSFPVGVNNISILISTHKDKFTGICTLHPHYEDAEAAYIGLLGVHPSYLGKGHGKALILESIRIATEKGLKRLDLDTWAGNLRAVPLYKKCGMFWVPETSVEMKDYIPGFLTFPLAEEFFKKYDWYTSQERKLDLIPDDFKLGQMDVFPYEFSQDQNYLKLWVDRYGRGILGVERNLAGEHLRILCRLKDHKVVAGLEHELVLEIENDTKKRFDGSVFLSAFEGLKFTTSPEKSFSVDKGACERLSAKFVVSPDIEVPDISRKQKAVKANLIINGKLIPFEVGMRIIPSIEITTYPKTTTVAPGAKGTLQLNLFNNSKENFKGTVFLFDEENKLSLSNNHIPIEIKSESYSGFNIEIGVEDDQPTSVITLGMFVKGKVTGAEVRTKNKLIHVRCLRPGGLLSSVEDTKRGKAVFVENEELEASVRLRGAVLELSYKKASYGPQKVWRRGRFGVGPPFGFEKPVDYNYEILRTHESLELVLWGLHPDKPGLKMMRMLTFYAGTPLVKEQIRVVNLNSNATYKPKVRISGRSFWATLYCTMIVPLKETVKHEMIGFPVSESDLPTDPENYRESWICFQNEAHDFCFGQIWSNEGLNKIRIQDETFLNPEYTLGEISPGQSVCTSELYYVVERGNWRNIRRRWKSLIEKKLHSEKKLTIAKPLLKAQLTKTLLYGNSKVTSKLEVTNLRNKEFAGEIHLIPPSGWKIEPSKIKVKKVTANNPFTSKISILPPPQAKIGVHSGAMKLSTEQQEIQLPLDFGLISKSCKSTVKIKADTEMNTAIFKVSNDRIQFRTSAEFAGCLYFLGDDNVNQLATSFPRIETKVFLENYCGGIRSLYLGDELDFQKSKTHTELYAASQVEQGDWKGVSFAFKSKHQEEIKGVRGTISYFTLPASTLLMIERIFQNPTSSGFEFNSVLWISPNVGGEFANNEIIFPRGDRHFRFKRAEGWAISGIRPKSGWVFIANETKRRGLGIIAGNPEISKILSLDLGTTMLELLVLSRVNLQPGESCKLRDYAILGNERHEQMGKLAEILQNELKLT
ncbi:MAG: GNAT family N-acetyltransferase [Candidatus Bathyarchaeota archaeon]|nr:GNAT family N-acetyltransferase [Candidatus Bathyarchaeota archaeon]